MKNTIDGCRTTPEGKRYFCLTIQVRHGNILYIVSSIAVTAEKYGGSAQAFDNGSVFFVDVMIKI